MQIDFQTPGQWAELNERLTELVPGMPQNFEVRAYPNVGSSLVEIMLGLAKIYPLKKKIAYIKNQDPTFDHPLMLLAREGYQMIAIPHSEISSPAAWLPQLDRETLFLLYSGSDPLLGISWPVGQMEQAIKDSTFQKIRVDHCGVSLTNISSSMDRNSTRVLALSSGNALAIAGERARLAGMLMPVLNWSRETWLNEVTNEIQKTSADYKNAILSFEKSPPLKSKPLFVGSVHENDRIFDRAAIFWLDLDAEVLASRLNEKLGGGFETASLSRWGGVRTMDWMKHFGLTPEMIRGLLLVEGKLLNASLVETINKVVEAIYREQQGH